MTAQQGTVGAGAGAGNGISPARWAVLSPWLDQLLDAGGPGRAALLADAQAQDAALARELQALLQRLEAQTSDAFMQTPARRATAAQPAHGSAHGQRIGAYTVDRLLGQGGMGSVWLARRTDGRYDGQVAIKFLHGGLSGRGDARRFAREGQILARLDHPHIARLLDAGAVTDDGAQPYLVLEFVQGQPIDAFVQQQALDTRATVALFMDVLAAVAHAHERLTLHRDLKPSNILVTTQGQVKLLDFGIAKLVSDALDTAPQQQITQLTQQAGRAFTLRYAAPEQVDHTNPEEATTATDVYALGVLLHELLTGGLHPTVADDKTAPLAQLRALVHTTPRRASDAVARQGGAQAGRLARTLQGDLDTIIGRALKKVPAERYRNAAELADDLRRYLHHEPIAARPDSASYRLARFVRRNRLGVAAGVTVALALGVGFGVALLQAREARAQSALASQQRQQAEGLVAFMLGDLRARLEPVGRLDVLDAVGGKVLGYYEQQDTARMDADAVGRRGQALTLLGDLAEQRGQLAEAERSHLQAVASLAELVRREPDNPQRLVAYAQGLGGLSVVQQHRGDLARSEAAQHEALALARRASTLRPGDAELLMEFVDARVNLAIFYLDVGRAADALPLLQQAHTDALRSVQTRPAGWSSIVNIRACIADAQYHLGRYDEAIATIQTQLQALAQVPGGADDRKLQNLRALGLNRMAGAQTMAGRLDEAAANFSEVVRADLALNTVDQDNLYTLSNLVKHRLYLAEVLAWNGKQAQARDQLQQAQTTLPRLLAKDDAPLEWRVRLRADALLLKALLNPGDALLLRDLQAYVADVAAAQARDGTFTDSQVRHVARVRMQLGDTLRLRGRTADAQAAWAAAMAMLQAPAQRSRVPTMATLAQLHWRLGDKADAQALVAQIDQTAYRHPEYVAFKRGMHGADVAAKN